MAQATLSCPFGAIHLEGRCPVRTLGGGVDPTSRTTPTRADVGIRPYDFYRYLLLTAGHKA